VHASLIYSQTGCRSRQSTPTGHRSAFELSPLIHCCRPAWPSFTCFPHQYLGRAHFIDNPIELSRFLLSSRPSFYEGLPSPKAIATSLSDCRMATRRPKDVQNALLPRWFWCKRDRVWLMPSSARECARLVPHPARDGDAYPTTRFFKHKVQSAQL
jgi:hypothetical protein